MAQKPPGKGKLPKDALKRPGRELMEHIFGTTIMKEVDKLTPDKSKDDESDDEVSI